MLLSKRINHQLKPINLADVYKQTELEIPNLHKALNVGRHFMIVNKLIQLRPSAHDLYTTGGILYERNGDTISSKAYFTKSLTICSTILDTISVTNRDYEMLMGNKATNLIMLDSQQEANEILKKLYDKQTNEELKKNTFLLMNKNKKQLLELWTSDQYSH